MLVMFTFLVVAVFFGYDLGGTGSVAQSEPVVARPAVNIVEPPVVEVEKYPTLVADMNAAVAAAPGLSASATLIDLSTGKEYSAGQYTQKYTAASTSKLVGIFDYIHQVELGKATLTKTIEGQPAQDIIMRMIINSDNDAWDKLNRSLKFKHQQAYLDSIGVGGKMVYDNIQFTTPAMAKMLQMLYDGKLMNAEHQAMVLDYMSRTTVKNLIQAALPADAKVYHKYGQIEGVLHDASIVEYQGHKFVLVVYTDNTGKTGQYTNQVNLIHAVSAAAFTAVTQTAL